MNAIIPSLSLLKKQYYATHVRRYRAVRSLFLRPTLPFGLLKPTLVCTHSEQNTAIIIRSEQYEEIC
jgi:hypothetical protein